MKFLLYISLLFVITRSETCQLCDNNTPTDEKNPACAQVSVLTSDLSEHTDLCKRIKSNFRYCCFPTPITPPQVPKYKYTGPNKVCDICRGKYPGNEGMVIHFLYMGKGTCVQYYQFGMEGKIPNHLCSAVQFYSGKTCNCIDPTVTTT